MIAHLAQIPASTPNNNVAEILTAVGAVIAAIGGLLAAILAHRNGVKTDAVIGKTADVQSKAEQVQKDVGTTNGQGTLADMVARIDRTTSDTADRMTLLDRRYTEHELTDVAALNGIHSAMEQIVARIVHLEKKARPEEPE